MEANILPSSHPLNPSSFNRRPSPAIRIQHLRLAAPHAASNGDVEPSDTKTDEAKPDSATRPQISTLNIRYRSKRQAMKQQRRAEPAPPPPKKEWEAMTLAEKAVEVYVGEKGLLFWLNKFAYASIFIIIGGWIVFRFVGPSLGLYQLDAPPLSPTSILKGSP